MQNWCRFGAQGHWTFAANYAPCQIYKMKGRNQECLLTSNRCLARRRQSNWRRCSSLLSVPPTCRRGRGLLPVEGSAQVEESKCQDGNPKAPPPGDDDVAGGREFTHRRLPHGLGHGGPCRELGPGDPGEGSELTHRRSGDGRRSGQVSNLCSCTRYRPEAERSSCRAGGRRRRAKAVSPETTPV